MFVSMHRQMNFIVLMLCILAFSFVVYIQMWQEVQPCPLCIFQRLSLIACIIWLFAMLLHNPKRLGHRIYYLLLLFGAASGILVAGRQVWLQYIAPPQLDVCGPGLNYMVQTLPIADVLKEVFMGTGHCGDVDFTLLGMSLAAWSLILFVALALYAVLGFIFIKRTKF